MRFRQDAPPDEAIITDTPGPRAGWLRGAGEGRVVPVEVLVFAFGLGAYFITRYDGLLGQGDTSTLVRAARTVIATGRLTPDTTAYIYGSGYGFPAMLAFIGAVSGLGPERIAVLLQPFFVTGVAIVAFALYREFSRDMWSARLGVVLLLLQPEFLFAVLRGTHEIFTRILIMLALLILTRSVRLSSDDPRLLAIHVLLFYVVSFSLMSMNVFFGSSYTAALATAVTGGWLWARLSNSAARAGTYILQRLALVSASCLLLVFLFMEYIYPPAGQEWRTIAETTRQISKVLLEVQESSNPYTVIESLWINPWVYLALTVANWAVLAASTGLWLRRTWQWLRYGAAPPTIARWLLWLLWAAFAAQSALAILSDTSGSIASNTQHRLFPSFATIAVGLIVAEAGLWLRSALQRYLSMRLASSCLISYLTIAALAKATNEPSLSNKWTFCQPEELAAVRWTSSHIADASIWTDIDERLNVCSDLQGDSPQRSNIFDLGSVDPGTRDVIITKITRLYSQRLQSPLPDAAADLRIYDNGSAEIYHRRAQTPYQR